jgi:hypothetical protein
MNKRTFVVVLLGGVGCGGGGTFATRPGSSVITPAVTSAIFSAVSPGYTSEPPPGAACDPSLWSYTVGVRDGTLAWTTCTVQGSWNDPTSFIPSAGDRALSPSERSSAEAALRAVIVSARRECGADAALLELRVASPDASQTYGDDFYGCYTQYDAFVMSDSLDNLEMVLAPLAH